MSPMSTSYTVTDAITFTVTHAWHLATKVGTDLKRLQRFYGVPSDGDIAEFEGELVGLLKGGYLGKIAYGFKRGEKWIEPTLLVLPQWSELEEFAEALNRLFAKPGCSAI